MNCGMVHKFHPLSRYRWAKPPKNRCQMDKYIRASPVNTRSELTHTKKGFASGSQGALGPATSTTASGPSSVSWLSAAFGFKNQQNSLRNLAIPAVEKISRGVFPPAQHPGIVLQDPRGLPYKVHSMYVRRTRGQIALGDLHTKEPWDPIPALENDRTLEILRDGKRWWGRAALRHWR